LLYVSLGLSIIGFGCRGIGVARAEPTVAAFFGNLAPLFAAVLSGAMVGEPPRLYHALAFALGVAGIVVTQRR
jgi:drug/metabolite transporter (DMT)-like permease